MAAIPTLRRLNDRERYWGLAWPEWAAALTGLGILYLAVQYSPLGTKATLTIVLFLLLAVVMVVIGVSGQALSPGRQLQAIVSYCRRPKVWALAGRPDRGGLVLSEVPALSDEETIDSALDLMVGDRDEF